ncbi:TPA: DEAD/DEAH box helicase family protein, partial [Mannheimia haemolytica]|nr:DEAD/DEAH box helicase family protein [Mannheimia haemolytica]
MELQFETLEYQLQAVNATVNLFVGQPNAATEFSLKAQNDMRFVPNLGLQISDEQLQQNLANLQNRQKIDRTLLVEQGKNFTVEMETGTGKTYVYLRTIFELNRQYGWQKFVIVVPSVAIREGVLHTLETTKSHFNTVFDNPSVNQKFEYKSNQISRLKSFASANHIEILVMNIDSFTK